MRYVLCETDHDGRDAGTKARTDIAAILVKRGWKPIRLRRHWDAGSLGDKLVALKDNVADWKHLSRIVRPGDVVVMQFPIAMFPKVSMTAVPYLRKMHERGVRFIALVHDLDSLRGFPAPLEEAFLPSADVIIAHNEKMVGHLKSYGYGAEHLSLDIFDYLTDCPMREAFGPGIDIAGNLKPEKAGYVYKLANKFPDASFNLYGPNYQSGGGGDGWYRGCFPPDALPGEMGGSYGLIWDGDSTETCTGLYGDYLRYNNPHKLSLYLACGKPVFIWSEAAEASFVESHGVGLAVGSIGEAVARVQETSAEQYDAMLQNAHELGGLLRSGHFTGRAVDKAVEILG